MLTMDAQRDVPSAQLSRRMRSQGRNAWVQALSATGAFAFRRSGIAANHDVIVLTLHRIVPDSDLHLCRSPRGMVLRESLFARLVDYLAANANMIAPQDVNFPSHDRSRPRVLLTFDDGWLDNTVVALPYLSRAGIRACFFIATSLAGHPQPFWPEQVLGLLKEARLKGELAVVNRGLQQLRSRATGEPPLVGGPDGDERLLSWLKQFPASAISRQMQSISEGFLRNSGSRLSSTCAGVSKHACPADPASPPDPMEHLMNWDQLRSLVRNGHTVGSHTCTHAILPQLGHQDLRREVESSRRALQQLLPEQDAKALWISYPNGSASHTVSMAARQAGYRLGFINTPGLWRVNSDPFLLPRVNLWDGTLVDEHGKFSEKHLEYSLFWRTGGAPAHA